MGKRLKGLEKFKDKFDVSEATKDKGPLSDGVENKGPHSKTVAKLSEIQQGSHVANPVSSRSRSSRL